MNDEYLEFWDHYNKDKFKLGVKILSKKNICLNVNENR